MSLLRIPAEGRTLSDFHSIRGYLAARGIDYERWTPAHPVASGAPAEAILAAYGREIDSLKARGSYVTADVIDVGPETPGLEAMLARFNSEHWHDEDEVRFIISGRGIFHIRPGEGPVFSLQVEAGDLIRVPRGTWHWFDLCADRRIRAIRLFQDPSGWTPRYTQSGAEKNYQPVCLGPNYLPPRPPAPYL
jgi:1,2-dihydroxy-3-keto-5-methylthiopentene dioxygenase